MLSCHSRSAAEAEQLGLVDEIAPDLALARRAALRTFARASSLSVFACRRWVERDLAAELAAGVDETLAALSSPKVLAALRAFTVDGETPWV